MNLHTETIADLQRAADLIRRGAVLEALRDLESTIDRLSRANIPLRDIPRIKARAQYAKTDAEETEVNL